VSTLYIASHSHEIDQCVATTADCTFVPTVPGSYVVSMAVADGCNMDSDTTTVVAVCGTPATAVLKPVPSFNRNGSAVVTMYGVQLVECDFAQYWSSIRSHTVH